MPKLDRFTAEDARRIGAVVGIDWSAAAFDVEQYRMGLRLNSSTALATLRPT